MKFNCKKVLQFLVYGGCLIGFVWIIFGEFTKFFDEVTSTSTSFISGARHFPDIIFCNSDGMKDGVTDQEVITFSKETYNKKARPINVNLIEVNGMVKNVYFTTKGALIFLSITSLDCSECVSNIVAQTNVFDIYTFWNGKCKVFQFNQSLSVGPKVYLSFDVDKTEDYFVMITSSNEYVFALAQQWLKSPPMTAEVKSNMFIEFQR